MLGKQYADTRHHTGNNSNTWILIVASLIVNKIVALHSFRLCAGFVSYSIDRSFSFTINATSCTTPRTPPTHLSVTTFSSFWPCEPVSLDAPLDVASVVPWTLPHSYRSFRIDSFHSSWRRDVSHGLVSSDQLQDPSCLPLGWS